MADAPTSPLDECDHGSLAGTCPVCNPRARAPRVTVMFRLAAGFGQVCPMCGDWISEGDRIASLSSGDYVHSPECEPDAGG